MFIHKKREALVQPDVEDRKREMTEDLMKVPEPGALFQAVAPRLPPQQIAEVAPQTPMSREAAERILSLWMEEEDGIDRPAPLEAYELRGPELDVAPDTDISAADYLAPDDVGPTPWTRKGGALSYSAGGGGGGDGNGDDEGDAGDAGEGGEDDKGRGAQAADGPTEGDHG